MKKSFCKTVLRTVRTTKSRFLAIFAIVALGSGFLAGVLASPITVTLAICLICGLFPPWALQRTIWTL